MSLSVNHNEPPELRARARRFLQLLVGALSTLALVACGADVNSELRFNTDLSGERSFVLTMQEDDLALLSGGIEAVEESFLTHLPSALSFEGIEEESAGYRATFLLPFDDLEQYEDRVVSLLEASGVDLDDHDFVIEISKTQLVTTLTINESFYNDDLMGWAAKALLEDGVVADGTTVLTSNGEANVVFDGASVDTSTSLPRMSFSSSHDDRFPEISLDVQFMESGAFRFTAGYLLARDAQDAQRAFLDGVVADLSELDGLVEPVVDESAGESSAGGTIREVTAVFSTPEAVQAGLAILLANDHATFTTEEFTADASADVVTQFRGEHWDCERICDPNNLQQLSGDTLYPEQWNLLDQQRRDDTFFVEFNRGMPLQALSAVTTLDGSGSVRQSFEFVLDDAAPQRHQVAIEQHLTPADGLGTFQKTTKEGNTVYTATFSEATAAQLTGTLNDYFASKGVTSAALIDHDSLGGLWTNYDLHVDLSPIWDVVSGGVEEPASFAVALPAMHRGAVGDEQKGRYVYVTDSSGAFTISASGPTSLTFWAIGITALFIGAIITLLIRTRRATRKVWSMPRAAQEPEPPYNVQGPKDRLTETQIFDVPPAFGGQTEHAVTTKFPAESSGQQTQAGLTAQSFPDLPVPRQQFDHDPEELSEDDLPITQRDADGYPGATDGDEPRPS